MTDSKKKSKTNPLRIDDLWQMERVGQLALAPDGRQAVCSVSSHSMEENKSSASLWLLSTAGGAARRLTACGEKDGQPAWSPTGEQIAFVARREQEGRKDDTPQLYLIAPDGGEARRASDYAPGIDAFKWFPDGRRIAFSAWVWPDARGVKAQARRHAEHKARKETGYVTSEAQYRYWDRNLPMDRVVHLHVLDTATGRVTDLFEGTPLELPRSGEGADGFDISPDGRRIVFAHDPDAIKRIDNFKVLADISVKSGRVTELARDAAWDFDAPRYSPDGRRLAFLATNAGRRHTAPAQLVVLPLAVGKDEERAGIAAWEVVSADWDHAVNAPLVWTADAGALQFTAEDRGRNLLWRFDLASRTASIACPGGWVHGHAAVGGIAVVAVDSIAHPARVFALEPGAAPRRIEAFNDALLARHDLGHFEEVTVTGARGEPVQVWLTYPPGFDARAKKKYPVLHSIHGGPHAAAGDTFHYRWNTQVFAGEGYVVACVNYHGSSGFGEAFLDSITHRWGELELQDVEAATDWLVRQPWADAKRVFATGGSYGGYMVAWMNGHVAPGRYQAYVCHAGCFDWTAMFSDDAYTWHAKELGAWYWDDAAKVDAQSPRSFVAAMQTPTLVVHGALDYRVPDQQGLAYYNTLQARGVPARLLWFPDENHWILKPRNSKLWYAEFFDWLRRHDPHGPQGAGGRAARPGNPQGNGRASRRA